MIENDRSFPPELAEVNRLSFDYAGGEGVDFEPYSEFLPARETRDWFRAWTGNSEVDGSDFRVFGQDGTGGYAAIWLAQPDASLLEQPVVFLGSEGEAGVVAADLSDYRCLLASGIGPYEAIVDPGLQRPNNPAFVELAAGRAQSPLKSRSEVLSRAASEFPGFREWIDSQCR